MLKTLSYSSGVTLDTCPELLTPAFDTTMSSLPNLVRVCSYSDLMSLRSDVLALTAILSRPIDLISSTTSAA